MIKCHFPEAKRHCRGIFRGVVMNSTVISSEWRNRKLKIKLILWYIPIFKAVRKVSSQHTVEKALETRKARPTLSCSSPPISIYDERLWRKIFRDHQNFSWSHPAYEAMGRKGVLIPVPLDRNLVRQSEQSFRYLHDAMCWALSPNGFRVEGGNNAQFTQLG